MVLIRLNVIYYISTTVGTRRTSAHVSALRGLNDLVVSGRLLINEQACRQQVQTYVTGKIPTTDEVIFPITLVLLILL